MKQQASIQTIYITQKEEVRYFSVRLPKDAVTVIGIETGLLLKDADRQPIPDKGSTWLDRASKVTAGTLLLQSMDYTTTFYTGELVKNDYALPEGDYSFAYYPLPVKNPKDPAFAKDRDYSNPTIFWTPQFWTHNRSKEEDPVRLNLRSPVINGVYKDEYGKSYDRDLEYRVTVYIWYETMDCKTISV